MSKLKAGRVLFRKIGGRIVPIRIKNIVDKVATESTWSRHRKIQALLPNGDAVGTLHLKIPDKGKTAEVVSVTVAKDFRKKGISKNLFKRTTDFLDRAGFKFLRSDDIQHAAQVKIRSAYGRYKAGLKGKNRTKFFADQFGPYGEHSKRITSKDAIAYIKQNHSKWSTGRQIRATTMVKRTRKK